MINVSFIDIKVENVKSQLHFLDYGIIIVGNANKKKVLNDLNFVLICETLGANKLCLDLLLLLQTKPN